MAHKRVLLLGPTGVRKSVAAHRLITHAKKCVGADIQFCSFEEQHLKSRTRNWPTFLGQDRDAQTNLWDEAWAEFTKSLCNETTVLGLHATYVSGSAGLRCPLSIPRICEDFKPGLIITLIDDVYSMWRVTEARARGKHSAGRPSLEQLMSARRAEILLGDVIASHTRDARVRHLVIATENSIECLTNLIVFEAKPTYLSFPISAPREMAAEGDRSFVDLIDEAHRKADEKMRYDRSRAFVSPLSIDELPFLRCAQACNQVEFDFDASQRWGLGAAWQAGCIVDQEEGPFAYPKSDALGIEGLIKADVGLRDRRLVVQSSSLAVVCPKPPNEARITRGVKEEIETAVPLGIECRIWQKPEWDEENYVDQQFPRAGSMGMGQSQMMIVRVESLDGLLSGF